MNTVTSRHNIVPFLLSLLPVNRQQTTQFTGVTIGNSQIPCPGLLLYITIHIADAGERESCQQLGDNFKLSKCNTSSCHNHTHATLQRTYNQVVQHVPNQILILCMFFSTSSHFEWWYLKTILASKLSELQQFENRAANYQLVSIKGWK